MVTVIACGYTECWPHFNWDWLTGLLSILISLREGCGKQLKEIAWIQILMHSYSNKFVSVYFFDNVVPNEKTVQMHIVYSSLYFTHSAIN